MEDKEIVEMYLARSELAITATSEKYGNYLGKIAKNILDHEEDAEECVNDAYFKAWRSIPPNHPRNLVAYLGRLTRNLALDLLRKSGRLKRGGGTADSILDELVDIADPNEGPESELDMQYTVRLINEYLSRQSKEKRVIFVRRYWYMDPLRDIALSQGVTEGKIKSVLHRMRTELKKFLEKGEVDL